MESLTHAVATQARAKAVAATHVSAAGSESKADGAAESKAA